MLLTYLGTIDPVYSSARPQSMRSFALSSLQRHHFLKYVIPVVSLDTTTTVSDRSTLAAQGRQIERWGGYIGGSLVAAMVLGADEEVLEEDKKKTLWSIVTITKSQTMQSISAPSEKKTSERHTYLCHCYKLRCQFEQFQMLKQQQNTQA